MSEANAATKRQSQRLSVDLAECPPLPKVSRRLVLFVWKTSVPVILTLIFGLPLAAVALLLSRSQSPMRMVVLIASPVLYALVCVLVAG